MMNQLRTDKRTAVIAALVEGTSINATCRITGVAKHTVLKLLKDLTNGFSKKLENHGHMVALYFFHYNFIRIHQTLCVTPAMEAGITDHVWSLEEMVALLDTKLKPMNAA